VPGRASRSTGHPEPAALIVGEPHRLPVGMVSSAACGETRSGRGAPVCEAGKRVDMVAPQCEHDETVGPPDRRAVTWVFIPVSIGALVGVTERDAEVTSGLIDSSRHSGSAGSLA
jgi:hypothetical protein